MCQGAKIYRLLFGMSHNKLETTVSFCLPACVQVWQRREGTGRWDWLPLKCAQMYLFRTFSQFVLDCIINCPLGSSNQEAAKGEVVVVGELSSPKQTPSVLFGIADSYLCLKIIVLKARCRCGPWSFRDYMAGILCRSIQYPTGSLQEMRRAGHHVNFAPALLVFSVCVKCVPTQWLRVLSLKSLFRYHCGGIRSEGEGELGVWHFWHHMWP